LAVLWQHLSVNYRHHFHAGNFADVMKHALLVQLVRGLQRKEGGLLLLDSHAGRGGYDLAAAATGDTLARQPEHPDGIGRLAAAPDLPPPLADYLGLVRAYQDRHRGTRPPADAPALRFYPGSPWLLRLLARPQDRLALCELHPEECEALRVSLGKAPRQSIQEIDGYRALAALLPPPERRALVLLDPPFESPREWADVVAAVGEGLRRFPSGTYVIWYPVSARVLRDAFFEGLAKLPLPPTLVAELVVNPGAIGLQGCGVVILNPPFQFEGEAEAVLRPLVAILGRHPEADAGLRWLAPE
jgi:23S rRNA (adenine2030-N6)-methyltransferase